MVKKSKHRIYSTYLSKPQRIEESRKCGDEFVANNPMLNIVFGTNEFFVQNMNGLHLFTDPRTENWLLMSGPGPLLTVLVTYLYFCTSVGPRYMRDRKPYDLKNTMILYNVSQILMSIFLVYEVCKNIKMMNICVTALDIEEANSYQRRCVCLLQSPTCFLSLINTFIWALLFLGKTCRVIHGFSDDYIKNKIIFI